MEEWCAVSWEVRVDISPSAPMADCSAELILRYVSPTVCQHGTPYLRPLFEYPVLLCGQCFCLLWNDFLRMTWGCPAVENVFFCFNPKWGKMGKCKEWQYPPYTGVTSPLHRCYIPLTQVLHPSYTGVTPPLHRCYTPLTVSTSLTQVFRSPHTGVPLPSHRCYTPLTQVFHSTGVTLTFSPPLTQVS